MSDVAKLDRGMAVVKYRLMLECPGCGCTFTPRLWFQKYCHPRCQRRCQRRRTEARATAKRRALPIPCSGCGAQIYGWKSAKRKWCSERCRMRVRDLDPRRIEQKQTARRIASVRLSAETMLRQSRPKRCIACGVVFFGQGWKFCSKLCADRCHDRRRVRNPERRRKQKRAARERMVLIEFATLRGLA